MRQLLRKIILKDFSKAEKYYVFLVTVFSALSVFYQTSISQELVASTYQIRSGFHIIFGIVHIFYGLGMFIAYRLFSRNFNDFLLKSIGIFAGLMVTASLISSLRLNINMSSRWFFIPLNLILAGGVLTLFGMIFSAVIVYFSDKCKSCLGIVVAWSLFGLILGFLLRDFLVIRLGANLLLVLTGLSAVLFSLKNRVSYGLNILIIIFAFIFPSTDNIIENFRDKSSKFDFWWYKKNLEKEEIEQFKNIFNSWSPYSKIDFYHTKNGEKLVGVYNYWITWLFQKTPDSRRQLIYNFVDKNHKVLCLAIGAGWPVVGLPMETPSNITGVELDPVIIEYFKKHPEENSGLFYKINIIQSEGRAFLDELKVKQDVIIVDLPGSPTTQKENPIEFENYLYTREAIERIFKVLNDDGILAIYILPHQAGPAISTVKSSGMPFVALHLGGNEEAYAVYSSRQKERLNTIIDGILNHPLAGGEVITKINPDNPLTDFPEMTDNRPYGRFLGYLSGKETKELNSSAFIGILKSAKISLIVFLFLAIAIVLLAGRAKTRTMLLYFFLIGVGFLLLQFFLYARFRSFFNDPMKTTLLITMILFFFAGIGSIISGYMQKRKINFLVLLPGLGLVLYYTYAGLAFIPFHSSNMLVKLISACLIIAPIGILSGIYFPLGLMKINEKSLGWALALDAVGTFIGFILFYFISWYFGISFNFYPIAVCYFIASILILL